ncbi:MAG: C-terminal binding protein [Oscillospiraceae bacterium]|nr:C-terminal binding protein [Oscillospiraceae bacterium]
MGKKVVILNVNYPDFDVEKRLFSTIDADLIFNDPGEDEDRIIECVRDADCIMTRETLITKRVLDGLDHCAGIVRYGVGVDNIDLDYAREKHIYVANVPDYGAPSIVPEHAMALMFAVARRLVTRDRAVRNGSWDIGAAEPMYGFEGRKVGIIGCGKIGRAFAKKISGIGFSEILGFDPYAGECEGIRMTDLETLFSESDIVSLHAPLTEDTYHIVNKKTLELMKPTAILINTSRGGLVDIDALTYALKNDLIFGAGIDVFEQEPPNITHELFSLDNVTVTDHCSWYCTMTQGNVQRIAAEDAVRIIKGEEPKAWCNPW